MTNEAEEKSIGPAEKLNSLYIQIRKTKDELKTQLARDLDKACRTYDLLLAHDEKDILLEPQFYEFMQKLSVPPDQLKKPPSVKQLVARSNEHRGEVAQGIRLVLEQATGFLDPKEIRTQVERLVNRTISPLHTALSHMTKKGIVVKEKGAYALIGKFKDQNAHAEVS